MGAGSCGRCWWIDWKTSRGTSFSRITRKRSGISRHGRANRQVPGHQTGYFTAANARFQRASWHTGRHESKLISSPSMQLKQLINELHPVSVDGSLEREILGINYDSRRIT